MNDPPNGKIAVYSGYLRPECTQGSLCKSRAALWSPCPGDPVRCHLPPIALLLPTNGAFWLIPILGSKRSQTFAEDPWREGGDDRPRSGHAFLAGKVLPGDCPRQAEPSGKAEWPDHNVSNMYIAMLSTNFGGTSGAFCSPNPKKSPEYPQLPPGFTPPDVARPACTPPAVHDRKRQGASPNGRTTPCASSMDCRRGHSK